MSEGSTPLNPIDKTAVLQSPCHAVMLSLLYRKNPLVTFPVSSRSHTSINNTNHRDTGGLDTSMANLRPDCHGQITTTDRSTAATPRPTNTRLWIVRIVQKETPELPPHELENPRWNMTECCCQVAGRIIQKRCRRNSFELELYGTVTGAEWS